MYLALLILNVFRHEDLKVTSYVFFFQRVTIEICRSMLQFCKGKVFHLSSKKAIQERDKTIAFHTIHLLLSPPSVGEEHAHVLNIPLINHNSSVGTHEADYICNLYGSQKFVPSSLLSISQPRMMRFVLMSRFYVCVCVRGCATVRTCFLACVGILKKTNNDTSEARK